MGGYTIIGTPEKPLKGAILADTNLRDATLQEVDLRGASLSEDVLEWLLYQSKGTFLL